MTLYVFYFLSFVAIFSALLVVFSKNPIYSTLYLILTMFALFGHYLLILNAQFVAFVHLIVYAGAVMVLFLYVIMLLNLNQEDEPHKNNLIKIAAVICAGIMLVILFASLRGASQMNTVSGSNIGFVKNLGKVLFTDFLLPFEISSILLLAAMVGVVMVGKINPKIHATTEENKPTKNPLH